MSLRILFFAQIKEQLDCSELIIEWAEDTATVESLHRFLCNKNNGLWRESLSQDNIIRAVNQTVAIGDCALNDGDEVAFFPPVTGG
ncbi:MAG: molybdopterin synthase sulfur carrier subunit [Halioglobus sp.]|jgi:molybdopterin synthase sulfur carrier subunit